MIKIDHYGCIGVTLTDRKVVDQKRPRLKANIQRHQCEFGISNMRIILFLWFETIRDGEYNRANGAIEGQGISEKAKSKLIANLLTV
jgi:hypothetical protein